MSTSMLAPEEVRALSNPSLAHSVLAIFTDWLLIALAFALAIRVSHPIIWIFVYIFIARQQLALAILMHDGAHRRFCKSAKLNDLLCQTFCAGPLFFSMYSYQKLHLKHHREPLGPEDPDLSLISGYPISKVSFARKIARDALGISYFKFIRYFIHMARKQNHKAPKKTEQDVGPLELKSQGAGGRIPLPLIVAISIGINALLFLILYLSGHGWLYLFFWILPFITALQVLLRVRGIAEHAGYGPNPDQRKNARSVENPIQAFIFAPHHVNFHIEHHAYPAVPFYNLPILHQKMMSKGLIPAENLYFGYGKILSELIQE